MLFMPAPMMTQDASITLSFVDSATSTGETITIPAGAQEGDVAVLFDWSQQIYVAATELVPTGFISIDQDSVSALLRPGTSVVASYRELGSGEGGSSVTGMNHSINRKVMLVFRPSAPISSITITGKTSELTNNDPAAQTSPAGSSPLVKVAVAASDNSASFTTEIPTMNKVSVSSMVAGYLIYNSSPQSQQVDRNDDAWGNWLMSCNIEVS